MFTDAEGESRRGGESEGDDKIEEPEEKIKPSVQVEKQVVVKVVAA